MKTYKNLYPYICAYDNLYESWRKAARGNSPVFVVGHWLDAQTEA